MSARPPSSAASRAGTKGGKLYVSSYSSISGKQIGLAARDDIKKPEDLIGRTVAYPRATGGHLYFVRYLKKYKCRRTRSR